MNDGTKRETNRCSTTYGWAWGRGYWQAPHPLCNGCFDGELTISKVTGLVVSADLCTASDGHQRGFA